MVIRRRNSSAPRAASARCRRQASASSRLAASASRAAAGEGSYPTAMDLITSAMSRESRTTDRTCETRRRVAHGFLQLGREYFNPKSAIGIRLPRFFELRAAKDSSRQQIVQNSSSWLRNHCSSRISADASSTYHSADDRHTSLARNARVSRPLRSNGCLGRRIFSV